MRKSILVLALVTALAGCKAPKQEVYWGDETLDPYMAELGYTISEDRNIVYKNNVPVFENVRHKCFRCYVPNKFYGPDGIGSETYYLMVEDELAALGKAYSKKRNDFMIQMGVSKPEPAADPNTDHFKSVK